MSKGWNGYAEEFNDLATFDNQYIHTGLGLSGIDPVIVVGQAESIIDIGCGEGTNTYLMYSVRQSKTLGIDIATASINRAKMQYTAVGCSFEDCDLESYIRKYDGNPFDLVTFLGSLDYIQIDEKFYDRLNQITKIGSRCYISKFHPMWTALYGNDVDDQIMKSYFDEGRVDIIPYGNRNKVCLERFHYNISYICNAFNENGWVLKLLQEPKPDIKNSSFGYKNYDTDDILMDRMKNVPMTIIFEFERRG